MKMEMDKQAKNKKKTAPIRAVFLYKYVIGPGDLYITIILSVNDNCHAHTLYLLKSLYKYHEAKIDMI